MYIPGRHIPVVKFCACLGVVAYLFLNENPNFSKDPYVVYFNGYSLVILSVQKEINPREIPVRTVLERKGIFMVAGFSCPQSAIPDSDHPDAGMYTSRKGRAAGTWGQA